MIVRGGRATNIYIAGPDSELQFFGARVKQMQIADIATRKVDNSVEKILLDITRR